MKDLKELLNTITEYAVFIIDIEDQQVVYTNPIGRRTRLNPIGKENILNLTYPNGVAGFLNLLGRKKKIREYLVTNDGKSTMSGIHRVRIDDRDSLVIFVNGTEPIFLPVDGKEHQLNSDPVFRRLEADWRSVIVLNLKTEELRMIRTRNGSNAILRGVMEYTPMVEFAAENILHPQDREYFREEVGIWKLREMMHEKPFGKKITFRCNIRGEYRYVEVLIQNLTGVFEGEYLLIAEKDVHELKLYKLAAEENDAVISALCREYHSIFLIHHETNSFSVMHMPDRYENIVRRHKFYEEGKDEYCDNYVCDKDRERIRKFSSLIHVADRLGRQSTLETTYQMRDYRWMAARFMEVENPAREGGRIFLLGVVEYDREREAELRTKRANEIITSLTGSYNAIFRVNLKTGAYEPILLKDNFKNDELKNFRNFFDSEEYYKKNVILKEYTYSVPRGRSQATILKHFSKRNTPVEVFYKENNGHWVKLTISQDRNYSEEYPYVIYAMENCDSLITSRTESILNRAALSRMYVLAMTIDLESDSYTCLHCDADIPMKTGSGSLTKFFDHMRESIYEEDFDKFTSLIFELNKDSKNFMEREYRAESSEGMVHFMSAFATYVRVPEGDRLLLLIRNIDEWVASRERWYSLNEEFDITRNMLYALGDAYYGIYYFNLDTVKLTPTRQMEDVVHLFRHNSDYGEAMKTYILNLVFHEDRSKVAQYTDPVHIRKELKEVGQRTFIEFRRLIGENFKWVRMDIQVIRTGPCGVSGVIFAFRDIHEERESELMHKKELQTALISAQLASQAKSEFLSNMSHDIRTPMNAILGMTDIALNHIEDKNKVKDCLTKMEVSAKHLLSLINEVLDMSFIESGKIMLNEEHFSLPEFIHGIVIMVQNQVKSKNLTFSAEAVNVRNEHISADRVRLNQIIINILGNAVKYTPNHKSVHLKIEQLADYKKDIAHFCITISDTGIGMSEEFVKKIFQPFERESDSTLSKIEGTGLGMTISKNLVEMMGGSIQVSSVQGEGSTFTVHLPLKYLPNDFVGGGNYQECDGTILRYECCDPLIVEKIREAKETVPDKPVVVFGTQDITDIEEAARSAGMDAYMIEPVFDSDCERVFSELHNQEHTKIQTIQNNYDFTGKRVLVVDDNEINCDIACDFLSDAGAETETAFNGLEALIKIRDGGIYDAVLMDIRMPVMNGYEATEAIRQIEGIGNRIPIIAMTANAFAEDVLMSKHAGMNDHISKPVNSDILYSVLSKHMV